MRYSADPDFTAKDWRPVLPGDKIPVHEARPAAGELSGLMYPPLARQIFPRDAEVQLICVPCEWAIEFIRLYLSIFSRKI